MQQVSLFTPPLIDPLGFLPFVSVAVRLATVRQVFHGIVWFEARKDIVARN